MDILKGMVQDVGYPDVECTYVKIDDTTLYYFIKDYNLSNGNIIATTNLKEAIGHAAYTSLGVINKDGQVLIPFENKVIKPIKDNLLLVEKNVPTTESVVESFKNKSDPFAAQSFAESAATIKKQLKDIMGMNGDFIFDNQFSEAALYTMDGINVAGNYFSFIGENNGNYYLATNVVGATIMKFNPSQLEQQAQIPPQEQPFEVPQQSSPQVPIDQTVPAEQQEMQSSNASDSAPAAPQSNDNQTVANNDMLNIDIPIQSMMPQEQPPIVNTGDEAVPEIPQSPDENEPELPDDSEIKLNIETEDQQNAQEDSTDEVSTESNLVEEETQNTNESDTDLDSVDSSDDEDTTDDSNDDVSEETDDDDEELEDEPEEDEDTDDKDMEMSDDSESNNDDDEENEAEETNTNETVAKEPAKPYSLTDDDIANPTIKDATNTIKKLLDENRKQRQLIDKQYGEIEALKSNTDILREENYSKEQEVQSLRQEMNDYRTQSINLTRENTKLKGTLTRQNDIMQNLEEQNTTLRNQVAGMHALSNAVAEANVLVQPLETDEIMPTPSYQESNLDIDRYLNGSYKNNNQEITYGNIGYLDDNDQHGQQENNEGGQSYQKKMVA